MREWLVSLIREAVRAEVSEHFRVLEDKAALTESALSSIRVKEKADAKKPIMGKQWGAIAREAERKSELV